MKFKFIILIALAITAVIAVIVFLFILNKSDVAENTLNEQESTPSLSLLTVINSSVQIKSTSDDDFQDVKESAKVSKGYQVKTSPTGRAIVESDYATTVIDKNSEVIIKEQSTDGKTKIELALGNLWANVQKFFNKGEYYQVETPNSVATVRGTSFGVWYSNFVTTILVSEGNVAVLSIDPITKQQIGKEIIVRENQKATIVDGKEPLVEPITDFDRRLEWYQFNQKDVKNIQPADFAEPTNSVPKEESLKTSPSPTVNQSPTSSSIDAETQNTTINSIPTPTQNTADTQKSTTNTDSNPASATENTNIQSAPSAPTNQDPYYQR